MKPIDPRFSVLVYLLIHLATQPVSLKHLICSRSIVSPWGQRAESKEFCSHREQVSKTLEREVTARGGRRLYSLASVSAFMKPATAPPCPSILFLCRLPRLDSVQPLWAGYVQEKRDVGMERTLQL